MKPRLSRIISVAALAFAFLFSLVPAARASIPVPPFAGITLPTDDGQTPREQVAAGNRSSDPVVLDANDPVKCSRLARERAVGAMWYPDTWNFANERGRKITAKELRLVMERTIQDAFLALAKHGDETALRHPLCVGLYSFGGPQAMAYREGYVAVDPSLVLQVRGEAGSREAAVLQEGAVYLHELAHWFLYVHGNPFLMDFNSRRAELSATCMSAALLALRNAEVPELFEREAAAVAVFAAKASGSSIEPGRETGSDLERELVALHGIDFVRGALAFERTTGVAGLRSQALLQSCARFIQARDKNQGPNGSR